MKAFFFFARNLKKTFLWLRLHVILGPFEKMFLNLAYMSRLSRWAQQQKKKSSFNDFFAYKFDYSKRFSLYRHITDSETKNEPIDYLEFGVAGGSSFKWWVENNTHPLSKFHGFDTFEGLPEDWGPFKAGDMSTGSKPPDIKDSRVKFYKGLFQQTLPGFIQQYSSANRKVIHMDADLYTSTLYSLTSLAPLLKKGDIILFDEYLVPSHEFLAFDNFIKSYYINTEFIGAANNYLFTAFKIV
ncbi:MAG: TylF/MycF/NovP-related O-methyltransferase [Chitinophagaceae bacterium]